MLREYMYDNTQNITGTSARKGAESSILFTHVTEAKIHDIYLRRKDFFNSNRRSKILEILDDDLCPKHNPFPTIAECHEYENGILMKVLKINMINLIQYKFNNL